MRGREYQGRRRRQERGRMGEKTAVGLSWRLMCAARSILPWPGGKGVAELSEEGRGIRGGVGRDSA